MRTVSQVSDPLRPQIRVGARAAIPAEVAPPAASSGVQRPRVSVGLWLAVIWYALEASQGVSRWLAMFGYQVAQPDIVEGTPLDRAVFTVLLVLALGILVARRTRWSSFLANNRFLCLLFLYMLVSILWSNYPDISFRRWVRSFVDLAMALVVLTDRDPLEAECTLLRRVMFINIPLSIILIKYFRTIGTAWNDEGVEMWVGTTTQKNVLGEVAMTAAIYFLLEIIRNRRSRKVWVYIFYLLMAAWILRGSPDSRSATSVLLLAIGSIILFALHFLRSRMKHVGHYAVVGFLVVWHVLLAVLIFEVAADQSALGVSIAAVGRDATLTGRTDLWKDVWDVASEHSVFGVGYGSFWVGNTHHLWDIHIWRPTQGHNGYLDVYVELGVVGIFLLVCTIVAAYVGALRLLKTKFELGALHLVWLSVIVLHNITESSYLRGSMDLWFLFLLSSITIPPGSVTLRRPSLSAPPAPEARPEIGRPGARAYPVPVRLRPR